MNLKTCHACGQTLPVKGKRICSVCGEIIKRKGEPWEFGPSGRPQHRICPMIPPRPAILAHNVVYSESPLFGKVEL